MRNQLPSFKLHTCEVSLLCLLLMFSNYSISQINQFGSYAFPDIRMELDEPTHDLLVNELVRDQLGELKDDYAFELARHLVNGKFDMLRSGRVYDTEFVLSKYLRKFLTDFTRRAEIELHSDIHLGYSDVYNAVTMYDGTIVFNVGLLADIRNEADLAYIIGHELSHGINNDVIEAAIQSKKETVEKLGTLESSSESYMLAKLHENRDMETRCDTQSIDYCRVAGYSLADAGYTFKLLDHLSNYRKWIMESSEVILRETINVEEINKYSTHPDLKKRLKDHETHKLEHDIDDDGSLFQVLTPDSFRLMQRVARVEKLNILSNQFELRNCIREGLKYYMQDPSFMPYSSFILNATRKICQLNESMYKEAPICDLVIGESNYKDGMKCLELFFKDIEISKQVDQNLWNELILDSNVKTYEDLIAYFAKILLDSKTVSSYLDIALVSDRFDWIEEAELLQAYSAEKEALSNFASQVLDRGVMGFDIEHVKPLCVINHGVSFALFHNNISRDVRDEKKSYEQVRSKIEQSTQYKFYDLNSLPVQERHLADKAISLIEELSSDSKRNIITSFYTDSSAIRNLNLYNIFPEYYNWFQINNPSDLITIKFTKVRNGDVKKSIKNLIIKDCLYSDLGCCCTCIPIFGQSVRMSYQSKIYQFYIHVYNTENETLNHKFRKSRYGKLSPSNIMRKLKFIEYGK